MIRRPSLLAKWSLLVLVTFWAATEAAANSITVEFPGTACAAITGTSPLDLTGKTCGNIKFYASAGGSTKAEVYVPTSPPDADLDYLAMRNTLIKAESGAVENFRILFKRQHTKDPQRPGTVYYNTSAVGTLSPVDGNKIELTGYVAHPTSASYTQMGNTQSNTVLCIDPGDPTTCDYTSFNLSLSREWTFDNLDQDRMLKVEFALTLAHNSVMNLDTNEIKIYSSDSPDIPIPQRPERKTSQCFSAYLTCLTTQKTHQTTRALFGGERKVVAKAAQAAEFVETTWDNLSQELAQGRGEHMASLAALLDVPSEQQAAFSSLGQERYRALAQQGTVIPAVMLTKLKEDVAHQRLVDRMKPAY